MKTYKITASKGSYFCYLLIAYKSKIIRVKISPDYSGNIKSIALDIPFGISEKKLLPIIRQILGGKPFLRAYRKHIAARGYSFWLKENPIVLPDYLIWVY